MQQSESQPADGSAVKTAKLTANNKQK